MKQTFKNFRFNLVESERPGYHKVKVGFVVDNKRHDEYLFIRDKSNKNDQYYIDEAMKQVEAATGANFEPSVTYVKRRKKKKVDPNQPVKKRRRKHYGDKRPVYVCSAIMGVVALTFGGLFVGKLLANLKKDESEDKPGEKTTITLGEDVQNKIELTNHDVIINQDFDTEIKVKDKEDPYILEGNTVICCGDDTLCLDVDYYFATNQPNSYKLHINGDAIQGKLLFQEINFTTEELNTFHLSSTSPKASFVPKHYQNLDYKGVITIDDPHIKINTEESSVKVASKKVEGCTFTHDTGNRYYLTIPAKAVVNPELIHQILIDLVVTKF